MRPVPKSWEDFRVLLGPHVPRGAGEHLGGTGRAGPVDHAETPFAMDSGLAVGPAAQDCRAVRGVADRRAVRRTGARTHGLLMVRRDERLHWLFGRAVNLAFKFVPRRAKMHPRARAGTAPRAAARTTAGAIRPHATCRPSPSAARASTTTVGGIAREEPDGGGAASSPGICASRRGSARASPLGGLAGPRTAGPPSLALRSVLGQFRCARGGPEPGLDLLPHAVECRHSRRRARYRAPEPASRAVTCTPVPQASPSSPAGLMPRSWPTRWASRASAVPGKRAAGGRIRRHAAHRAPAGLWPGMPLVRPRPRSSHPRLPRRAGQCDLRGFGVSICQASHGSAAAKAARCERPVVPAPGTTA